MKRIVILGLLAVLFAAGAVWTGLGRAASREPMAANAATRQSIKAMPLLERPNRVGHFYGNTVRRAHDRRGG